MSIACVVFCVLLQYQGISWLWRLNSRGGPRARARIAVSALYLIGLHLLEVAIFGVGYLIGERLFGIGAIAASRPIGMSDVFYYSAEVFSTLGLGDVYATSDLRMLTSVEALSGMLLLSWSASFLVLAVQGARGADQNPEL